MVRGGPEDGLLQHRAQSAGGLETTRLRMLPDETLYMYCMYVSVCL